MAMIHMVALKEAVRVFGSRQNILDTISASSMSGRTVTIDDVVYLHEFETLLLNMRSGEYKMRLEPFYQKRSRWVGSRRRQISSAFDVQNGGMASKGITNKLLMTVKGDVHAMGITLDFAAHTKLQSGGRSILIGLKGDVRTFNTTGTTLNTAAKRARDIVQEVMDWHAEATKNPA